MPESNLAGKIERMPAGLVSLLREAGLTAQERQQQLYLVGGGVRDLLLERPGLDLDLVVEGDAIALAQEMARRRPGKLTVHHRFGTAKLSFGEGSLDMITARGESYARPGALPQVRPGTITDDLARRDFTINAMAARLNPKHFGELLDPHGGQDDLAHRLVRVLHGESFVDDATRIWRAVRYEQRLGFHIEPDTLKLLKRDISRLDTISGDRLRHELELVLEEAQPEKALQRAGELGALSRLHPSLKGDGWLAETFALARQCPEPPSPTLYLALLAWRLTTPEAEQLIASLKLQRAPARILRDTGGIKEALEELSLQGLAPSRIYRLLHGYSPTALAAAVLAAGAPAAGHIGLYRDALRHARAALTGADLIKLGVPQGPQIKETLEKLLEARLDGKVSSRQEEEDMVRGILTG